MVESGRDERRLEGHRHRQGHTEKMTRGSAAEVSHRTFDLRREEVTHEESRPLIGRIIAPRTVEGATGGFADE